jgi:hypothetical protein
MKVDMQPSIEPHFIGPNSSYVSTCSFSVSIGQDQEQIIINFGIWPYGFIVL